MLWATACAQELRSPIWPRYPAETPSEEPCCAAVALTERLEHRERRLVARPQARLAPR